MADVERQAATVTHRPIYAAYLVVVFVIRGGAVAEVRESGVRPSEIRIRVQLQVCKGHRIQQLLGNLVAWRPGGLRSEIRSWCQVWSEGIAGSIAYERLATGECTTAARHLSATVRIVDLKVA